MNTPLKPQLHKHIVNSRFRNCAGCRALFKTTNNGYPFVWCYLNKQMIDAEKEVLDKRLDFMVKKRPVENCKVKTNIEMVNSGLNGC